MSMKIYNSLLNEDKIYNDILNSELNNPENVGLSKKEIGRKVCKAYLKKSKVNQIDFELDRKDRETLIDGTYKNAQDYMHRICPDHLPDNQTLQDLSKAKREFIVDNIIRGGNGLICGPINLKTGVPKHRIDKCLKKDNWGCVAAEGMYDSGKEGGDLRRESYNVGKIFNEACEEDSSSKECKKLKTEFNNHVKKGLKEGFFNQDIIDKSYSYSYKNEEPSVLVNIPRHDREHVQSLEALQDKINEEEVEKRKKYLDEKYKKEKKAFMQAKNLRK